MATAALIFLASGMRGGFNSGRRTIPPFRDMETPHSENFNQRLSQWVANQGFWFQVRYSMSGSGVRGRALFYLLRMAFRVLVFLVVVALGTTVYLLKRTDSEAFRTQIRGNVGTALAATELEMSGVQRSQGQLEISSLAAESGGASFFDALEARTIRMRMSPVDGLLGAWNPGNISIARLEVDLKAGTDDAEGANQLAEVIFRQPGKFQLNSIQVDDATLRWGYSEQTRGSIENSEMRVQRIETGWRLSFKNGIFRQNWLRQLDIIEMVVLVERGGVLFERAEFKQGRKGTVEFPGLRVAAGERPQVDGVVKIRNVEINAIEPPALLNFLDGTLTGDFKAFGSTNTSDGIGLEGQVILDGGDVISLRDRFHILKALSVVDYSRNYRRIDFSEGSFVMRTHAGGMSLKEIDMAATVVAEDTFTMEGEVNVRLPTQQEIDAALAQGTGLETSPLFISEDELAESRGVPEPQAEDFTLRRAAQEARRVQEGSQSPESLSLFKRLGLGIELRRLRDQAAERMSRMLQYEGKVRITLPGDVFERAPRLREMHPPDAATGRVALDVPIKGNLYEVTLRQAEEIYELGRRHETGEGE